MHSQTPHTPVRFVPPPCLHLGLFEGEARARSRGARRPRTAAQDLSSLFAIALFAGATALILSFTAVPGLAQ